MQSLTLEGKIMLFKILDISKIVYFSMTIKVPTEITVELEKMREKNRNFKNVDINKKIVSLQCSWIKDFITTSYMNRN